MSERKIGFDRARIEPKIIAETDEYFVMRGIIAREMVQPYGKVRMLKDADELEKACRHAQRNGTRTVTIGSHPDTKLVMRNADSKGTLSNFVFAKDLLDPKTKRPMDRGIKADILFYKDAIPQVVQDELKQGLKPDVSIGFTYDEDMTPGEWRGMKYDGVQRNIFIDHLAAGIDEGRCPSPFCGLGLDSIVEHSQPEIVFDEGKCPVCRRMLDVGLETAGSRLYAKYGADVLEVIEGNPLPTVDAAAEAPKEPAPPQPPAAPETPPQVEAKTPTQNTTTLYTDAQAEIEKSRSLLKHFT